MDVQLPDGTTIQGVPDGTTKAQLAEKLQKSGRQVPREWMAPKTAAPQVQQPETVGGDLQHAAATFVSKIPSRGLMGATAAAGMELGDKALAALGHKAGDVTLEKTGSPLAATVADVGISQGLPMAIPTGAIGKAMRAAPGLAAKAAESEAVTATQAAQKFFEEKVGIPLEQASADVKQRILSIAKDDPKALDKLSPEAVARLSKAQSLAEPVNLTKGQAERSPEQLRAEQQTSQLSGGQKIADRYETQDQALAKNLDLLRGKTGAKLSKDTDVGRAVQDTALRRKEALSKQGYQAKYKAAEDAGELQGPVDVGTLAHHLDNAVDPTNVSWVAARLEKLGAVERGPNGELVPKLNTKDGRQGEITLAEAERIRQAAVEKASKGDYDSGQVAKVIDQITEGSGGQAYKAARAAFKAHQLEFHEQGSVDALVRNKTRLDRATAVEDTWDRVVVKGSVEDINKVKRSLLTGGTPETRTAGRQAWREIRGKTIDTIRQAAQKSAPADTKGNPGFSYAGLRNAIAKVGDENLDAVLGPGMAKKLRDIADVARDVKTNPAKRIQGSDTAINLATLQNKALDKILNAAEHLPVAKYVVPTARRMVEETRARQFSEEAVSPLGKSKPVNAAKAAEREAVNSGQAPLREILNESPKASTGRAATIAPRR